MGAPTAPHVCVCEEKCQQPNWVNSAQIFSTSQLKYGSAHVTTIYRTQHFVNTHTHIGGTRRVRTSIMLKRGLYYVTHTHAKRPKFKHTHTHAHHLKTVPIQSADEISACIYAQPGNLSGPHVRASKLRVLYAHNFNKSARTHGDTHATAA